MYATASWVLRIGLVVTAALPAPGCGKPWLARSPGKSLLTPAQMSPDAMALEIFFARFPQGDPMANDTLWREIDEQHFATHTRRELAKNGFRVGLVTGQIPVTLAQLLEMKESARPSDGTSQVKVDAQAAEPKVVQRHLQLRPGCRSEIIASGTYDEMTLLLCEPDGVCGRTYRKAQGVFAVQAFPEHDGRVRVELVPELQHGDPKTRFIGDQGMWRLDTGREKRVLDVLALSATLAPGEMLVLSSLPDRPGSLGHQFFADQSSGHPQQKLLLIRVAQTQHNGLFSPGEVLPLDGLEK
jgi:hypothetical protein